MLGISALIVKTCNNGQSVLMQQTRNTFVLKRRFPPSLHRKGGKLPKMRARHFIYDLVENTSMVKKPDMQVILKQFVDGAGKAGDILTLRPSVAYKEYLMPGLAVYASPENLSKNDVKEVNTEKEDEFSSPYVHRTISCLSRLVLSITMSKLVPWTLEPWHVRASFRKTGFIVPEYAIDMPPVAIKGPDLSLQEKEFYVTVTINKREKVNVRCRIHHWATGVDRLPWSEFHWKKPLEALIPEQAAVLQEMPLRE